MGHERRTGVNEVGSLLRSDVVRNVDARGRGYVFANVGAVLKPPLMKLFRSSEADRGEGGAEGAQGAARSSGDGRRATANALGK